MKLLVKIKNRSSNLLLIILAAAVVVVLNIAASFVFKRFDLTQDNIYTLALVSKKTSASFSDNVIIIAYFSKNLPASFLNLKQEIQDKLKEKLNQQ